MDAKTLAKLINEFESIKSLAAPTLRYTSTFAFRDAANEFTGFGKSGMSMPEIRQNTISNLHALEIISRLLEGNPLSAKDAACLGVNLEEYNRLSSMPWVKKPERPLVVLTFDDAFRDDIEYAAPILQKYGFNATFFVTEIGPSRMNNGFSDKTLYMFWEEIKGLYDMGFEIGSHSYHHRFNPQRPYDRESFRSEVLGFHEVFDKYGMMPPTAFGYPGGRCVVEMTKDLKTFGYTWGRGNLISGPQACIGNGIYLPKIDNRFATPAFGDTALFSPEKLETLIRRAGTEGIVILAYHQIHDCTDSHPANMSLEAFIAQMEKLKELNCIVTSYAGITDYFSFND